MMMPANFSAISENEMTYVNGGASLADILAPELKVENWKKFNTNMVTIIGNSFMGKYINNTIGVLFDGAYRPGDLGNAWYTDVNGAYKKGYGAGFGAHDGNETTTDKFLNVNNGLLNGALRMVGSAAAIYNLATGTVKNAAEDKLKVDF
uniref:hypothetical protein n=1 Tax=Faecalibacterium sp. TaxID=1971605 RepID=UPI004025144A